MPRRYIDTLPDDIQESINIIIYQDLLDNIDEDLDGRGQQPHPGEEN